MSRRREIGSYAHSPIKKPYQGLAMCEYWLRTYAKVGWALTGGLLLGVWNCVRE